MAFAPRRRRPRWLIAGVVMSVVALSVNAAWSSRSEEPSRRLAQLKYLDDVRPHVVRSARMGAEIADVRHSAPRLGRTAVLRRMARARRESSELLRTARAIEAPGALGTPHTLLLATLTLRARSVDAMAGALDALFSRAPAEPAVAALVRAGEDLLASDRTYRAYVDALPRPAGAPRPPLPPAQWVADAGVWTPPEVGAFAGALRSSQVPSPVHDLRVITMATDPLAVGNEAGTAILPATRALRVEVVVANTGNAPARGVPVMASVTGPAGEVDTARDFVDLAPGQRQAVPLAGLRPVPGGPSTLRVAVGPVDGETEVADNERTMVFVVRG